MINLMINLGVAKNADSAIACILPNILQPTNGTGANQS